MQVQESIIQQLRGEQEYWLLYIPEDNSYADDTVNRELALHASQAQAELAKQYCYAATEIQGFEMKEIVLRSATLEQAKSIAIEHLCPFLRLPNGRSLYLPEVKIDSYEVIYWARSGTYVGEKETNSLTCTLRKRAEILIDTGFFDTQRPEIKTLTLDQCYKLALERGLSFLDTWDKGELPC